MKYKDIYMLGVLIVQMMVGRFSVNKYAINLDNVPQTWSQLPESSTLITALLDCFHFDSSKKQRLHSIRSQLITDIRTFFKKQYYLLEQTLNTSNFDTLNKKGVMNFAKGQKQAAIKFFDSAVQKLTDPPITGYDSLLNHYLLHWSLGQITDQLLIEFLKPIQMQSVEITSQSPSLQLICHYGIILVGLGQRKKGFQILKRALANPYPILSIIHHYPQSSAAEAEEQGRKLEVPPIAPRIHFNSKNPNHSPSRLSLASTRGGMGRKNANLAKPLIQSPDKVWKDYQKLAQDLHLNNTLIQNSQIQHNTGQICSIHITKTGKNFSILGVNNQISIWSVPPMKLLKRYKLSLPSQFNNNNNSFTHFSSAGLDNKLNYIVACFQQSIAIFFASDDQNKILSPLKVLNVRNPDEQGVNIQCENITFHGGPQQNSLKFHVLKRQLNPQDAQMPKSQFNTPFSSVQVQIDSKDGKVNKISQLKHQLQNQSIFKYGLTYVNFCDKFLKIFRQRKQNGDEIRFPDANFQIMVGLRKPQPGEESQVFYKYNVFSDMILRKVSARSANDQIAYDNDDEDEDQFTGARNQKLDMEQSKQQQAMPQRVKHRSLVGGEKSQIVYDVSSSASFILYGRKGENKLYLHSMEVPRQVTSYMSPSSMTAIDELTAINPGKLLEKKLEIGEQVYSIFQKFKIAMASTNKSRIKDRKTLQIQFHDKLRQAFEYDINIVNQNFQFLSAYTVFMQLFGHRADKQIAQIYSFYSLNSIEFKTTFQKVKYFSLADAFDKFNIFLSFDNTVHEYSMIRTKVIQLQGDAVRGMQILPDDKTIITANTFYIQAFNRPHMNPNSKQKPHWQRLRKTQTKFRIFSIKLSHQVYSSGASKSSKILPLVVLGDKSGFNVYNVNQLMSTSTLNPIQKLTDFIQISGNQEFKCNDVDFYKKSCCAVFACESLAPKKGHLLFWDLSKGIQISRKAVESDSVSKVINILDDSIIAYSVKKKVVLYFLASDQEIEIDQNICVGLKVDKSKQFLFIGLKGYGIEIWKISYNQMGEYNNEEPVRVKEFKYPVLEFKLNSTSTALSLVPLKGRQIDIFLIQWNFKHLKESLVTGDAAFDQENQYGMNSRSACCQVF